MPGGLWRGSDQPLSRLLDARRHGRRIPRGSGRQGSGQALHQVDRQGPAQGHVEDGHLDLPVLLRRADLRRGRPVERLRRGILRGHGDADRRRRARRGRGRDGRAPSPGLRRRAGLSRHAGRRRRIQSAHPRRGAQLDGDDGRPVAARRARRFQGQVSRLRQGPERAGRAPADDPRPVPHQGRGRGRPQADPARRRGAGERDRQAFRHGRHVLRLDLARGAHHARDRDEPDRRQVEHRRGRRGVRSLQADGQRRLDAFRDQAGGVGPVRRDDGISRQFRHDADQDGAGRKARRRRSAARPQGRRGDRQGAPLDAGRGSHLAAAASRHLFDRGSGAAHLRPEER